jgi:predicted kinase
MIVIVMGLPGSGKSYFASRLAEMMNAGYISSDKVRKTLIGRSTYLEEEKELVYANMLAQMQRMIKENKDVVLDATFYTNAIRKKFINAAGETAQIIFIEIIASEDLIKERLKQIREDSEADFSIYKIIRGMWEAPQQAHLRLESTNTNIDSMLSKTLKYLDLHRNDQGRNK